MNQLTPTPLVSLVLLALAGPVFGQLRGGFGNMFDRFDQNGDGVLTSDELPDPRTAAFFERMGLDLQRGVRQQDVEQAFQNRSGFGDRGGDNSSGRGRDSRSQDESNTRAPRRFGRFGANRGPDDAQARERAERLAQRTVQRYDQNNDGVLASDEIPDRLRGDLEGLDANADGILSSDELANRYAPRSGDAQGGGSNPQQAFPFVIGPAYPAGLPSWFQQSDSNRDGQVALYEWDRRQLAQFKTYDQNDDGFITSEEAILSNQRSATAFGGRGNFGGGRGNFTRGAGRGDFGGGRGNFTRGGGQGDFGRGRGNFTRGGGRANSGGRTGNFGGFRRGGGR